MCGLCGELSFDGRAEVGAIAAMTDRQSNRGPDAAGIFLPDGMGLELTPKGHSKLWQLALLEYWLQTHGI
jgi:asparagine synthetase B (glutamine-hydrolysing)